MGGICDKLLLLIPGIFHRLYRPAGKQDADEKKEHKATDADEYTVAGERSAHTLFAGNVNKDQTLAVWSIHAKESDLMFRDRSRTLVKYDRSVFFYFVGTICRSSKCGSGQL